MRGPNSVISLLIDDPKTMTIDQAERQVDELEGGYLAHVYSSCDATLARAAFLPELVDRWVRSKDEIRRRCGYGLLYELSKSKKKNAPTDAEFLAYVKLIERTWQQEGMPVLMAQGLALMGLGKRSAVLHKAALKLIRRIGPIDFDPDGRCEPMDFEKHLTNPRVADKFS